jgi:hypothetical protein
MARRISRKQMAAIMARAKKRNRVEEEFDADRFGDLELTRRDEFDLNK